MNDKSFFSCITKDGFILPFERDYFDVYEYLSTAHEMYFY